MKSIYIIIYLLFFNGLFFCECPTYGYANEETQKEKLIKESIKFSNIIFIGQYLGDKNFHIIETFKGKNLMQNKNEVKQVLEETLCDFTFIKTEKYLVFGKIDNDGFLYTSTCLSNLQINDKKDFQFLYKYLK